MFGYVRLSLAIFNYLTCVLNVIKKFQRSIWLMWSPGNTLLISILNLESPVFLFTSRYPTLRIEFIIVDKIMSIGQTIYRLLSSIHQSFIYWNLPLGVTKANILIFSLYHCPQSMNQTFWSKSIFPTPQIGVMMFEEGITSAE